MKNENNALVTAQKNGRFIELSIVVNGIDCSIKVNDFGGKQKERASKLTYKIYKSLGGK